MSDSSSGSWTSPYTAKQLRELRKSDLQMSMEELAERLGYDYSTVQRYETGEREIKREYVEAFEALRTQVVQERLVAEHARRVDLSSVVLPPGMRLVQLVPVEPVSGQMTPIYAAVPKESAGTPAPGSGSAKVAAGGTTAAQGMPPTTGAAPNHGGADFRRYAAMACMAAVFGTTNHFPPSAIPPPSLTVTLSTESNVCRPVEGPTYTELSDGITASVWSGTVDWREPLAATPSAKKLRIFKKQKHAPCDALTGEVEADEYCWWELAPSRACPPIAEKQNGMCLVPVPEPAKKPMAAK